MGLFRVEAEGKRMERRYRLKKNRAFQYVYRRGHSVACRNLVMLLAPGRELKVGFSVSKKVGNAVSYRQFAPPSFVAFVILGLLLSIFIPVVRYVVFPVLLLYLAIIFIIGIIETFKHKRIGLFLLVPLTFICIHFAYGIGYLKGLLGRKSLTYTLDR